MPYSGSGLRNAIVMAIPAIVFACSSPQAVGKADKKTTIDMDRYTIEVPSGGDWKVDIRKETGEVQFTRQAPSLFGRGLPATVIHVSYTSVLKEEMLRMDEEEIAIDYRSDEHIDMIRRGVFRGLYELHDVKKDHTILNGKKLYTLSYKQWGGESFGRDKKAESTLYLYFPADFKKTHTFYRLLISHIGEREKEAVADPAPMNTVIDSLQIKQR